MKKVWNAQAPEVAREDCAGSLHAGWKRGMGTVHKDRQKETIR